jgi:hypothetical protein
MKDKVGASLYGAPMAWHTVPRVKNPPALSNLSNYVNIRNIG